MKEYIKPELQVVTIDQTALNIACGYDDDVKSTYDCSYSQ